MQRPLVVKPTEETLQWLRTLIESAPCREYSCLPGPPDPRQTRFEQVRHAMDDPTAFVVIMQSDGTDAGLTVVSDLPWDSQALNVAAAEIKEVLWFRNRPAGPVLTGLLQEALRQLNARGVRLVVCKTDTGNMPLIHALEGEGFRLMDTLLEYVCTFAATPLEALRPADTDDSLHIRLAADGDRDRLMDVARCAFADYYGRFHSDERIDRKSATDVYRRWLCSACSGYGDWVFVAERDGRMAGFCVWKRPTPVEQKLCIRVAHLSIVAVHPEFAGRKYFQALTYAGMKQLKQEGFERLTTWTHINNLPAQRGWSNLGWRMRHARHTFHLWL